MQFNSVDIEGVEFYQLGPFKDYRDTKDYADEFAFERRYEKRRWIFVGSVLMVVALLIVMSFLFIFVGASVVWPHPVIVLAAGALGIFEAIGIVAGLSIILLGWVLGSMVVATNLMSYGLAMSNARKENPSRRRSFASGWYKSKALISSRDFAFKPLRSLVEAAKTKEELADITTFFTSDTITKLHESLRYDRPLEEIKQFKLELIDAIEELVAKINSSAEIDFKQLRDQVQADYLAAVKAKVSKKEKELEKLRAIVA